MAKGEVVAFWLIGAGLVCGATFIALGFLASCNGAGQDAKYGAGFELCLQTSHTCEEYLECWQANQRAHRQVVTGSCRGAKDGGE